MASSGAHSSPTLFNLVMNLLCYMSKECEVSFYVDDSKFAMAIKSPSDCITLREGCQFFVKWCNEMGLVINGDKCKTMTISRAK